MNTAITGINMESILGLFLSNEYHNPVARKTEPKATAKSIVKDFTMLLIL
tara:strand:- start:2474 stop:2623 length:150 start_codon:yes stop_codon:yes gene_type:complete